MPEPPSVDGFVGAPAADDPEPLVLANLGAPGPIRVAVASSGYQIPLPSQPPIDVAAFNVPRVVPAWVMALDPERSATDRRPGARSVAAAAAGLVVLAFSLPTHAAPPEASPASDPAPTEATSPPAESMAPEPEPADPPVAAEPQPTTVAPVGQHAAIDAAWEGVVGYDVTMELRSGRRVEGRVSAVQSDTFTLIDFAAGGVVRVMSKAEVASVRVRVPEPLPTNNGTGLLIGGGILTAIGAPVLVSGIVFLGLIPSGYYLHLPMLLTGGPAVGAGIAMLVSGTKKRRAYNAAMQNRTTQLTPTLGRTRRGTWTGGLTLRF